MSRPSTPTCAAIAVDNLSKRYRLGLREAMPDTFTKAVGSWLTSPLSSYRRLRKLSDFADDDASGSGQPADVLYALRDVSLRVETGEVIGIIGRNGSGKSTFLKVLSRITEPTRGRVEVRGRVASLLEIGTGFHPELTGRENVYLNGTILGMRKREIDAKFDQIAAFADIDAFLDTPVKRYSSGMYVRLAFAVAAHLDPEILLIDEVLAVGDAAFQAKCLGRLGDVASTEGRTVLFVSHNMEAVSSLCSRAVVLDGGRVLHDGSAASAVKAYMSSVIARSKEPRPATARTNGAVGDRIRLISAEILPTTPRDHGYLTMETEFDIAFTYENRVSDTRILVDVCLYTADGTPVLESVSTTDPEWTGKSFPAGTFTTRCRIPANFLNAGAYSVRVLITDEALTPLLDAYDIVSFSIADAAAREIPWYSRYKGNVHPKLEWRTNHRSP